jgi:signal transduction histidine kinase/DNA-binding response OmpR family regulator
VNVKRPALFYALLLLTAVPVFVADWYTPLGVSVWILYLVPLALTLLGPSVDAPLFGAAIITALVALTSVTDAQSLPGVGYANRLFGMFVVWPVAWLTRQLLITRNAMHYESRLRGVHGELLRELQGEAGVDELSRRTLRVVGRALSAPASAMYASEDQRVFRLTASDGVDVQVLPSEVYRGDGLIGQVIDSGQWHVVEDVPSEAFRMSTALTSGAPRHLALMPLAVDDERYGILELALNQRPDTFARDLLERVAASAAIALRTAAFRERVRSLLMETQRQRDEVQAQQEELRVANEELEEQSLALKTSQSRLQEQQAELEATNAQLESQTQELEVQQQALAESAARAEQASQYKSEFLANMSHELRTPLNSVLILAKLLADNRGGGLSAEQVRFANTIHSSGSHLLTLINDILDLARIESGRTDLSIETIDLHTLADGLREIFEPIARDRGLDFSVEVADDAPRSITSDAVRLQQVVVNLLSNACKFTVTGHVRLRIEATTDGAVALHVQDTGPGIPPDKIDLIFEAFRQVDSSTQRRFGGTGLGLSISRQLAHLLGGELLVESVVGQGSRFSLVVPQHHVPRPESADATPAVAATTPTVVPAMPARRAQARPPAPSAPAVLDDRGSLARPDRLLLIVEDDPAFASILYDLAHELEFDGVVASTTDEGFRLATELRPTGILLDVSLPDGSGLALLDRLKRTRSTRHIPVHMMSVDDHTQTALALGAVGYAVKPATRETLLESVRRIEAQTQRSVRRLLIVEDDEALRSSMVALLQLEGVELHDVGTGREALQRLSDTTYDCVVLDLSLPDASGFDVLDAMSASQTHAFPPVIIYTGRALSAADEERLRRYSRSVIVKGARSPERLLDEVTLFLHRVESTLPTASQRMLRAALERDEIFEGRRILLAEDDVRNIFALSAVLEPRGATMVIARNGREAVDLARAERPDLVLMDIMMPEMDGLAATRAIRAEPTLRDVPIIALTAKARREDREQCLEAGANDYMAKPIDVDKLVSLCRVWMAR